MPPVGVVLISYWLLGKKEMTTTKLILILIMVDIPPGIINTVIATPPSGEGLSRTVMSTNCQLDMI